MKNAPLFIRLLDELGIDAEEFNIHSEKLIHIDLRPFFSSEISRISLAGKAEFKNALYAQLSKSSIECQEGFLDELDRYTRFAYSIENTKHTDVEQVFLAQWKILSDTSEQSCDADAAWRQNRDAFEDEKDKAVISDLLSDKVFDSLLYFGAVDDLEKMYNSRVKTIEEKSKTDADVLGSSANLHAPISEINVIAPKSTPAKTKLSGAGSRKIGMVAERENAKWGAKAEEIVYNSFKDTRKSVRWVSENAKLRGVNTEGIAGLGYDLTYIDEDSQLIYVEIKSSTSDSVSFMMSANEMEVAEREAERYIVALVVNVEKDDMRKIYEIKNLFVYDEGETRYSNKLSNGSV